MIERIGGRSVLDLVGRDSNPDVPRVDFGSSTDYNEISHKRGDKE